MCLTHILVSLNPTEDRLSLYTGTLDVDNLQGVKKIVNVVKSDQEALPCEWLS